MWVSKGEGEGVYVRALGGYLCVKRTQRSYGLGQLDSCKNCARRACLHTAPDVM